MAGNFNIKNANGKTLTIQNPDTNNADIVIDGSKIASTVSPTFTGTPTAPTQTAGDNSTKIATTAYVDGKMVLGTVVTASGTAIDFTGIPSWVKRITVMFNGVSTNGTSLILIQLGSGSIQTSGYISSVGSAYSTSGLLQIQGITATDTYYGTSIISNINNNDWVNSSLTKRQASTGEFGGGSKTLSATLDRIRITTVNGTDTFDAGQINIMYEG